MAVESGWSDEDSDRLREAALLHDVGRIAVPWVLLARDGELAPEELASIREYAEIGAELLAQALDEQQISWVASHLERWDGSGSPTGLAGREIPSGAQIIGIADTWDALINVRPYRPASRPEDALAVIGRARGAEFAPGLVNLFFRVLPKLSPVLDCGLPAQAPA
jgi:putative two-component system response regulator